MPSKPLSKVRTGPAAAPAAPPKACALVNVGDDGTLSLDDAGLAVLRSVKGRISVVAVCGMGAVYWRSQRKPIARWMTRVAASVATPE